MHGKKRRGSQPLSGKKTFISEYTPKKEREIFFISRRGNRKLTQDSWENLPGAITERGKTPHQTKALESQKGKERRRCKQRAVENHDAPTKETKKNHLTGEGNYLLRKTNVTAEKNARERVCITVTAKKTNGSTSVKGGWNWE